MALRNLVPLFILFVVVSVMAFIGFIVYGIVQGVSSATRERMEKRHILVTKDGVTVNVKELNDEDYVDRSQRSVLGITLFLQTFLLLREKEEPMADVSLMVQCSRQHLESLVVPGI